MCLCASCSYTDGFSGRADLFTDGSPTIKGFDNWPRGNPAGKRSSDGEYRSHVGHLWQGVYRSAMQFKPGQAPIYPSLPGLVHPVAPMPARWYAWNKASPALAEPARPAQACKPEQHFPERDRAPETAVIYAMPKEQPKRPVGRPPIGRRVVVNLEEEHIKRAEKLGGGNVSAGIRKALARRQSG